MIFQEHLTRYRILFQSHHVLARGFICGLTPSLALLQNLPGVVRPAKRVYEWSHHILLNV